MTKEYPALEFFVVGGSVHPDRPCYIERPADQALIQSLREQRFSYVLGPRGTGKSSLLARVVRDQRGAGHLVAVVDLSQLAARGESAEAGRWVYSIAYRIVRQLRIKVDLQAWWQQNSGLVSEQRLAEFFWDVVLTNTTEPILILIDDIERAMEAPVAGQLFAAIRGCYTNRTTEPDYARLNFAVFGTATPAQLCPDPTRSPFELGRAIELQDFTLAQTHALARGFDLAEEQAQALLDRVHQWTAGYPYLTQKVARGVVRRGGFIEAVERTVREQFLMPAAAQGEPLLTHIRGMLLQRTQLHRQALALLGKVARGESVPADPVAAVQQLLQLAGVVRTDASRKLQMRNRIFAEIFTSRWVHAALPLEWRRLALVAAVAFVLVAVPIWYVRYLPQPYVRTLSVATQDAAVAEEAYQKLHRLPGFRGTADRLLSEVLTRRSRQSEAYEDVLAADQRLRALPDGATAADALLGEYWLRRAAAAIRAELRDEALLLASRAAGGQPAAAEELMTRLIDTDYQYLTKTTQLGEPPAYWAVDWDRGLLTAIDAAHRVQQVPLASAAQSPAAVPDRLTAVQHVPLARELAIDAEGSAGAFTLEIVVDHPVSDELTILLEAPSGARASLSLPQRRVRTTQYEFSAAGRSPLAQLADEARRGIWRLTVTDRRVGNTGALRQWGLRFGGDDEFERDIPEQGVAIPDPVRTEQITLELSGNGHLAIARPARAGAIGALSVWDLDSGQRRTDLALDAQPEYVQLTPDGRRLIVIADSSLLIWDTDSGKRLARVTTQSAFAGPPAVEGNGRFLVMAESLDGSASLVSLLSVDDGQLLASVEGPADPRLLVLGPDAKYLAVVEASRLLRVIDPRRGTVLGEWAQSRDIVRLMPSRAGGRLFGIDAAGDVLGWQLEAAASRPAGASWRIGTTIDPASVSLAADGRTIAFEAEEGQIVVRDALAEYEAQALRVDAADATVRTSLTADGRGLLSLAGAKAQWWTLPAGAAAVPVAIEISAISADAGGAVVALGSRDGRVRFRPVDSAGKIDQTTEPVDFIGHQGAVTALAIDLRRDLAASGGADGVVRLWDTMTGAPRAPFMRHPEGPIRAVAISPSGRWIASAAEYSARLWRVEDGQLGAEVAVNGTASALAFAPVDDILAVGDSAGNVFFAQPEAQVPSELRSLRAASGVSALGFGASPDVLLVGDLAGQLRLWHVRRGEPIFDPQAFRGGVRWVAFEPEPGFIVAQTNHWLHRLAITAVGLEVVGSSLVPIGAHADGTAITPDGSVVTVGHDAIGQPSLAAVVFTSVQPVQGADPTLLARDWSIALGLEITPDGRVLSLRP